MHLLGEKSPIQVALIESLAVQICRAHGGKRGFNSRNQTDIENCWHGSSLGCMHGNLGCWLRHSSRPRQNHYPEETGAPQPLHVFLKAGSKTLKISCSKLCQICNNQSINPTHNCISISYITEARVGWQLIVSGRRPACLNVPAALRSGSM